MAQSIKWEDDPVSTTQPNQMRDNSLEQTIKHLDINDLLKIAESVPSLISGVYFSYRKKFGHMKVALNGTLTLHQEPIKIISDSIELYDIVTSLKFLRVFGRFVFALRIRYYRIPGSLIAYLDYYIQKYCTSSLKKLYLYRTPKMAMKHLRIVFPKMECIQFWDSKLHSNLTEFNKWFPKMRVLEFIEYNNLWNPECIANYFPNLQHLTIDNRPNFDGAITLDLLNITKTLRLNNNLKGFCASGDMFDATFFLSINNNVLTIERLEIQCRHFFDHFVDNNNDMIFFTNVKEFTLNAAIKNFDYKIPKIPLLFHRLQKLTLVARPFRLNEHFLDFIQENHRTLRKLKLYEIEINSLEDLCEIRLMNALQDLTHITFVDSLISLHEVLKVLQIFKSIVKFSFHLADPFENDIYKLKETIDDCWEMKINKKRVVTLKKRK